MFYYVYHTIPYYTILSSILYRTIRTKLYMYIMIMCILIMSNSLLLLILVFRVTLHSTTNQLRPTDWIILVRSRLLLPVVASPFPCPCECADVDLSGSHCLKCRSGSAGLIARHDGVRTVLASVLRANSLGFRQEFRTNTTSTKPGDLVLFHWKSGKHLYLDVM
jgi:hypothetical protein